MVKLIDNFLNSITMYRLVVYGLLVLIIISIVLSFFRLLPYTPIQYLITLLTLMATCLASNFLFSKILKAQTNFESYLITAFILFFVLAPINNLSDFVITFAAAIISMASKYLFAINRKHIFNPVAITAFLLGLFGFGNAIWWVGSINLLPFVIIVGLLVVRKIRRFYLLWSYLLASVITLLIFNLSNNLSVADSIWQIFTSWPLIFFGTIMLTEPLTTPPNQKLRIIYGVIVGIFFGSQFHIGPFFSSPELALVVGNIFSFLVSPKQRLFLKFKQKNELAPNIYEFIFTPDQKPAFTAGQFLEWTLPHKNIDSRGNRRYFTIASSPTESEIKLGVKVSPNASSSFKKALLSLNSGELLSASQLAGDFILPNDLNQKIVLIAGGIGVTPFRSMIQNMLDANQKREVILFYTCVNEKEFVYKDIFSRAKDLGLKVVYVITNEKEVASNWSGEKGYLTIDMIKKYVPDFSERVFYLSGPSVMVDSYKNLLHKMNIQSKNIVTDYFPGF